MACSLKPNRTFFTIVLLAVIGCSTPPASSPVVPAGTPEVRRERPQAAWPAGLKPCPKDAPAGEGCATRSTSASAPAPSSGVVSEHPGEADSTIWKVPVGPDDPVRGPVEALVTVVEFSDFECPFCRREAAVMKQLLSDYPKDVRLVWKDCPLPMHAYAEAAAELARAARAAKGDAGFWRVHDAIYEASTELGEPLLRAIAQDLGFSWDRVSSDMRKARYGEVIRAGIALSDRVDVRATPTVYVNGRKLTGAVAYEKLRALVEEERDKARRAMASSAAQAVPAVRGEQSISRNMFYDSVISSGKQVEPPTDLAPH